MMVSSKGRYALRVMLDMAYQTDGGNIRLKDIAERQNISRKYLESIMTLLCKHELVESSLGKDGGYKLVRKPEDYPVGEILRAAEGELVPVSCLAEDGKKCDRECNCYTLPFWKGLEAHINEYIDHFSLADLMAQNAEVCHGSGIGLAEKKEG